MSLRDREMSPTVEVTHPPDGICGEEYALVNLAAKRVSRAKKPQTDDGTLQPNHEEARGISPPPPIPAPSQDLGVDLSEYDKPPIPLQSEGVHELVSEPKAPYAKVTPLSDAVGDPPYAKVAKGYDPPYASVARMETTNRERDAELGYDYVDIMTIPEQSTVQAKDKALGYDTVGGEDKCKVSPPPMSQQKSKLEHGMPTLEGPEIVQPLYDHLEVETEPQQPSLGQGAGEMYNQLSPEMGLEGPVDDGSYAEIDESTRLRIREKLEPKQS